MAVLTVARDCFRTRAALQMEVFALRHQLNVLRRSVKRPKLTAADRFLWARLSRYWTGWRSALVIVKPETVIDWSPLKTRGSRGRLECHGHYLHFGSKLWVPAAERLLQLPIQHSGPRLQQEVRPSFRPLH